MEKSNLTPEEKLAGEVENDFLRRQQERKSLERSWQLNMNFVSGNQYCDFDAKGEIAEEGKDYYWQQRLVFNHIAPIVDTRLSKLSRIRPALTVRAASDEESDRHSAALASAILTAVHDSGDLDGVMNRATLWSEVCGTAFYKVIWNSESGNAVGVTDDGTAVREGNAEVVAVSPFEIYPYSLSVENLDEQLSVIHAKALPVEEIYGMYGVRLAGKDIKDFIAAPILQKFDCPPNMPQLTAVKHGYELVLERYIRPSAEYPEGRLTVVAGGKVLFDGELPYKNGEDGARDYPFVKQVSMPTAGCFFGTSVVDRLIPLQRAYNAVKCRKHEFLNRIAMGVVAVEDGSVDADELAEDGLMPGKVISYRQGSKPPEMLTLGSVPSEFGEEEENILNEFNKVAGTGNLSDNATNFAGITSATGLQLIIEQDDQRLNLTYNYMKRAVRMIGRHVLRLYRQFASDVRLLRYAGQNNVLNLVYFKGSDVSSDDVVIEADSDLNMSPAQKRTVIYEALDRGLFNDESGKISSVAKSKILDLLGYSSFVGERDLDGLNRSRAGEENLTMANAEVEVKGYDNHAIHIVEHTAYLLSEKVDKAVERRIYGHINAHKAKLAEENI
ncbi:MAG: hypothetical protein K2O89_02090 [Clostridia bacterium]|nr:hypothetical protein [Clostridia bacterium]